VSEQENSSSGFRVVDRRPFAADGSRKQGAPAEEEQRGAAPEPERRTFREQQNEPRDPFSGDSAGFETLVSYLSTTAMFQLGLIPGPSGEQIPSDLPNAKRTIDLLEILKAKTKGNLTANESQLLEDVLYDLRLSFVELQKRQARKSK
jgi:hypothetical protein